MFLQRLAATLLVLILCAQGSLADAIILKDGSCFTGSINIRTSKKIWVELSSGETRTVNTADIDRIIDGDDAECPGGTTTPKSAESPLDLNVKVSVAHGLRPVGAEVKLYEDMALSSPAGTVNKMSRAGALGLLLPATPAHSAGWQAGLVRYEDLNGVYFFPSDSVSDCDVALFEITCTNSSEKPISNLLLLLDSDPIVAGDSLAPGAAITAVSWRYLSGSAVGKYDLQDAQKQLEALLTRLSVCISPDGASWTRIPGMAGVIDSRRTRTEELCSKCEGNSGTCSKCKGTGEYGRREADGLYRYVRCSRCGGRGYIRCKRCNNTGFITKTIVEKDIRPDLAMSAQAAYTLPVETRQWMRQWGDHEQRLAAARAEFKGRQSKLGLSRRLVYGERAQASPTEQAAAKPTRRPAANPQVLTKSALRDGAWGSRFLSAAATQDLTMLGNRPFRCTLTCKGKDQYEGPGRGGTNIGYADNVLHIEKVGWDDAWQSFTIVAQLDVVLTYVEGIHTGPSGYIVSLTFPLALSELERAKIERGFGSRKLVITIDWEPARTGYEWDQSDGNSIQNAAYLARVLYFQIDAF